ncbi:hypothetical protein BSF41_13320 [Flavobacterium sp. ACN2]|nr:hypothetical protein BSF41_13320 [Flavobacterium sp. ACN2]
MTLAKIREFVAEKEIISWQKKLKKGVNWSKIF